MNSLIRFILSSNRNDILFKILILLTFYLAYLLIKNKRIFSQTYEGFDQTDSFILKREADIYDDFYVDIYDNLFDTMDMVPFEIKAVETTQPNASTDVLLDAHCETGHFVAELDKKGYSQSFGIHFSPSMILKSREIHPNAKTKLGHVSNPMEFEPATFSHILCSRFGIYHYSDKKSILRNYATWLRPKGYLLLHLVDPDRFDPIVPAGKLLFGSAQPKDPNIPRITDTFIDYDDYTYKCEYQFPHSSPTKSTIIRETFTDSASGHVRQNERTMWFESSKTILNYAIQCGFILTGQIDIKSFSRDNHQFIYILEK